MTPTKTCDTIYTNFKHGSSKIPRIHDLEPKEENRFTFLKLHKLKFSINMDQHKISLQ